MLSAAMKPSKGRDPRRGGPGPRTNGRENAQAQGLARMLFAGSVQQGYEAQVQVRVRVVCMPMRGSDFYFSEQAMKAAC